MPARTRRTDEEPEPEPAEETEQRAEQPRPMTVEELAAFRDRLREKYH